MVFNFQLITEAWLILGLIGVAIQLCHFIFYFDAHVRDVKISVKHSINAELAVKPYTNKFTLYGVAVFVLAYFVAGVFSALAGPIGLYYAVSGSVNGFDRLRCGEDGCSVCEKEKV